MPQTSSSPEKCHRAEILRHAIHYIRSLQSENKTMRAVLGYPEEPFVVTPPSSSSGGEEEETPQTDEKKPL